MNVLLVDDQPDLRDVLQFTLERRGCACDVADNGREALALCAQTDYDLIVMDYVMPGLDGCETAERIRQSQRNASVPIVAFTGEHDARNRCLASGMNAFVVKGTPIGDVLDIFEHFMKHAANSAQVSCGGDPSATH